MVQVKNGTRRTWLRIGLWLSVAVMVLAACGYAWSRREAVTYESAAAITRDVEATVAAIGVLQPRRYVDVGAQVSGQITRIYVAPGDTVKKGDRLLDIDPSVQQAEVDAGRASLAGLHAQLAEEQAQLDLAQKKYRRQRVLVQTGSTSRENVDVAQAEVQATRARIQRLQAQLEQTQATLKADEARLGYTRIYATMDGTVVTLDAREGQTLTSTYQTPNVLRVADLSGMTVWAEVSEADIGLITVGMPVTFTTLGGQHDHEPRQWRSTVRQILPAPPNSAEQAADNGKPAAATKAVMYTVLFDVNNDDGALMPQMTAQVTFVSARAAAALVVPLAAIGTERDEAGRYQLRVLDRSGKPQPRAVRLGIRSRHEVQVLEGLEPGMQVVTGESVSNTMPWFKW